MKLYCICLLIRILSLSVVILRFVLYVLHMSCVIYTLTAELCSIVWVYTLMVALFAVWGHNKATNLFPI